MSPKKLRGVKRAARRDRMAERAELQTVQAIAEAQSRKTWSTREIDHFAARTERQADAIRAFCEDSDIALLGTAGTGKTITALYLGLREALTPDSGIQRVHIIRSAVAGREQGFLPGTEEEKYAPFERPYRECLATLFKRAKTYDDMKAAGKVAFETTSYLRGATLDNAVILVDEAQNMTFQELNTVLTRIGRNARVILIGDIKQNDLQDKRGQQSGFSHAMAILQGIRQIEPVYFTRDDIVRSGFVKSWICAVEDYEQRNGLNLLAA